MSKNDSQSQAELDVKAIAASVNQEVKIQRHPLRAEDMMEFSRHVAAEHKKNPKAEISLSGYIADKFYAGEKNMVVVPDLRGVLVKGEGNFWDEARAAEDEYLDAPPYLDLAGVDFSGSLMQGASFNGCDLSNSLMCDSDLNGTVFSNTKVGGLDLRGADLVGCEFSSSYDQVKHIPKLSNELIGDIKLGMTSQLARRYADIKAPALHQKEDRQRRAAWKVENAERIKEWNKDRDERVAAKQEEVNEAYKETTGYLASWVYNPSDEDQDYHKLQEELKAIKEETVPKKEMPDKEYVIHKSFQRVVGSDSTTFDPCYKRGSTPEERRAKTQYIETSRADVEAYLDELQQNPELTLNEFAKQKFIAGGGEIAEGTIVHADCSSGLANMENDLNRQNFSDLDFTGANLQGVNFAGSDLSNCNFTGANISDASLEGAVVSDAKFVDTKAQGANLFDANIQDAKFNKADFSRAYMSKSDATNAEIVNGSNFDHAIIRDGKWDGVNIDNSSFNDVDFRGVSLANAVVKKTQMRRTNLEKSVLDGCKFIESDLREASLEAAKAHKAEFTKTMLENVNAKNLDISEALIDQYCNLEGADLEDAIMKDLRAQKVNFTGVNLDGVDASGAQFQEAVMENVKARFANFTGAVMDNVKASGIDMSGSNLTDIKARGAHFEKAIMRDIEINGKAKEADLTGAYMQGVDIRGANIKSAIMKKVDLRKAQIQSAKLGQKENSVEMEGANVEGLIFDAASDIHGVDAGKEGVKGGDKVLDQQLDGSLKKGDFDQKKELDIKLREEGRKGPVLRFFGKAFKGIGSGLTKLGAFCKQIMTSKTGRIIGGVLGAAAAVGATVAFGVLTAGVGPAVVVGIIAGAALVGGGVGATVGHFAAKKIGLSEAAAIGVSIAVAAPLGPVMAPVVGLGAGVAMGAANKLLRDNLGAGCNDLLKAGCDIAASASNALGDKLGVEPEIVQKEEERKLAQAKHVKVERAPSKGQGVDKEMAKQVQKMQVKAAQMGIAEPKLVVSKKSRANQVAPKSKSDKLHDQAEKIGSKVSRPKGKVGERSVPAKKQVKGADRGA